jgi:hypothetical protein
VVEVEWLIGGTRVEGVGVVIVLRIISRIKPSPFPDFCSCPDSIGASPFDTLRTSSAKRHDSPDFIGATTFLNRRLGEFPPHSFEFAQDRSNSLPAGEREL